MDTVGRIRVSDADREAIVARLNAATAEGRLTLDEFSDRARRAYESRTWDDLARLVDDLPVASGASMMPTLMAPPAAGPANSLPLLALIFGLLSFPMGFCVPLGLPVGAVGVVLGFLGLRRTPGGLAGNRWMALAGLICGLIGIASQVVMLVFLATIG